MTNDERFTQIMNLAKDGISSTPAPVQIGLPSGQTIPFQTTPDKPIKVSYLKFAPLATDAKNYNGTPVDPTLMISYEDARKIAKQIGGGQLYPTSTPHTPDSYGREVLFIDAPGFPRESAGELYASQMRWYTRASDGSMTPAPGRWHLGAQNAWELDDNTLDAWDTRGAVAL